MKRTKILHIIRPAAGGMKEHLLSLIKNSDHQRFEIMVVCSREGSVDEQVRQLGIPVYSIDLKGKLNFSSDLRSVAQLVKLISREKFDLVHCHGSKAGLVGRVAATLAGVPVIVFTAHNFIFYGQMPVWQQRVLAWSEKLLAYNTDRIITVSQALKENLIRMEKINPAMLTTIYNGIENCKFQGGCEQLIIRNKLGLGSGPVVGVVARLAPQKGLSDFLKAAAVVVKTFPHCQFLIVGDGPLKGSLQELTSQLQLHKQVYFLGHRQDVEKILPLLDVFVLSSLTEGLPLTILEAMAAGRPIVATRVGGIPEVITHGSTGLLAEPGNSYELALSIIEFLQNPAKAAVMGNSGQRLVNQEFGIGSMAAKTMQVYMELLTAKGLFGTSTAGHSVLE